MITVTEPQVWTVIGVFAAGLLGVLTLMSTMFLRIVRTEIGSVATRIDSLDDRMNVRIDSLDTTLGTRIDSLDSTLNARMDGLGARIESIDRRIDHLDRDVQTLASRVFPDPGD
ncbi:MAG: hypothetical protein U0R64_06850 [Candidatus Nanopelagicales bacterium]